MTLIQKVCSGCGDLFIGGHGCFCDDCATMPIHIRVVKKTPRQHIEGKQEAKARERGKQKRKVSVKYADA